MPYWSGGDGDITDATKYYGLYIDTSTVYNIGTNIIAWFPNHNPVGPSSQLIFNAGSEAILRGPTPKPPGGGESNQGQITVPFLIQPVTRPIPYGPPAGSAVSVGGPYTVSGSGTFDGIYASGLITFSGALTLTAANSNGQGPALQDGGGTITGTLTIDTWASVGSFTLKGVGNFKGISSVTNSVGYSIGQGSLLFTEGLSTIAAGATATTAGVFVGVPTLFAATLAQFVQVDIAGTLTDSDTSNGIQIGVGAGAFGAVVVAGNVNSATVTVGGTSPTNSLGQGLATIKSTGTWANSGTLTIGAAGTLTDAGILSAASVQVSATLNVNAGTLVVGQGANAGGIDAQDDFPFANISVTNGATVTTQYLHTQSATTTTIDNASLTTAGQGATGIWLGGTVALNSATVNALNANASILVGYESGTLGTNNGVVTQRGGATVANSTTIGAGGSGGVSGTLTIINGSWTDQGAGTTMTIGAGTGSGSLLLQGGATLTDQSVAMGAAAGPAEGSAGSADLNGGSDWNIRSNLTVGGSGAAQLSAEGHSTIMVGGSLTVTSGANGSSVIDISQATLNVAGGNITINGTGSTLDANGPVMDASGTVHVSGGNLSVSNSLLGFNPAGTLLASTMLADGAGVVSLGFGFASGTEATIDVMNQGATITGGATLRMHQGSLQANTVTVSQGGTITGDGTIGNSSQTAIVTATGGTVTATDIAGLIIQGTLIGGTDIISGAAALIANSIQSGIVAFQGSSGYLGIKNGTSLGATVTGFVAGDEIDFSNVIANSATWSGNELFLYNGRAAAGQFALQGSYADTVFHVANDSTIAVITIGSGSPPATPLPKLPADTLPSSFNYGSENVVSVQAITDDDTTDLTATISDLTGILGVTASGSALVSGEGQLITVSGALADVNATLATLTYTPTQPGGDTISIEAVDDQGAVASQSTSFTVPDPGVTLDPLGTQAITAGSSATITGVALSSGLTGASLAYTVTLTDMSGTLSAVEAGAATVTGTGSSALMVSGDLADIDSTLATLAYTGAVGAAAAATDTIEVTATDAYGAVTSEMIDLAITQPATPTETQWAGSYDGDATLAGNWTTGVPTGAVLADVPDDGYETINGPVTASEVTVEGDPTFTGAVSAVGESGNYQTFLVDAGGAATFDGGTLTTPSLVLGLTTATAGGDSGSLTLTDGAQAFLSGVGPLGQAEAAYLGFATNGALEVQGSTLTASTGMSLGYDGIASVDVNAGGTITTGDGGGGYADVILGDQSDGFGEISVEDAGSRFGSAAPLYVGLNGEGVLDVSSGGMMVSAGPIGAASAFVGADASGDGFVALDGEGSTWDVTQNLALGYLGTATVSVTDGATLEVDGALVDIGHGAAASGELDMYGPGASLSAAGAQLVLGLDGSALLNMSGGAAATVGSVVIGENADAVSPQLFIDDGVLNVAGTFTDGAATGGTSIYLDDGTIATGGGFDVGNGADNVIFATDGAAITGGIGLASAATLDVDQTTTLGGTITFTGGSLSYSDNSGLNEIDTLSNAIVVGAPTNSSAGDGQSTIDASSTATLDLTGGIAFAADSGLNLLLAGGLWQATPITGFAATDTLDLSNAFFDTLPDTATWSDNVLSLSAVQYGGGAVLETVDLIGDYATTQFSVQSDGDSGVNVTITACYAEGARIATARGAVPVEELREGDLVQTLTGGEAPVIWLGHRRTLCDRHPNPSDVMPVRVRRGAFAPNQPSRDLVLSPDHSVFMDGVLIPIRHLINGRTVVQERVVEITYWHVELPRHAVVLAEGLPCESYLDTGNRGAFANGGAPVQLHPDFAWRIWETQACAPLIRGGAELEAARSWLRERAAILGHKTTRAPLLRVLAAGREVLPEVCGSWWRFNLPPHSNHIRVASRRAVPAHMHDDSEDHRPLGVAVSRITLDGQEIALTDPRLGTGWHAREGQGTGWRWTTGDAAIDAADARVLDLDIALTERYWLEQQTAPAAELAIA